MREITWRDEAGEHHAAWPSATEPPAGPVVAAGDMTRAADALRLARAGSHLVYRGDYHNARQLLTSMARRLGRSRPPLTGSLPARWRALRKWKREDHLLLSRLLVPVDAEARVPLRRAPDLRPALEPLLGEAAGRPSLLPLREVVGAVGAAEWRRRGVEVPALGGRVHPLHGVFAPIRGEYVSLVAAELDALPAGSLEGRRTFDVGTGTGVLALLLARRGAGVTATDVSPRAAACARDNAARFGVADRVEVLEADLFPPGRADLVLANPPWLPGGPETPLDQAVFDPGGDFLERFLAGLPDHLAPGGEGWLVFSDLAELLGLQPSGAVAASIAAAGLAVVGLRTTRPGHPRAADAGDPLHEARSRETVALYRLRPATATEPSALGSGAGEARGGRVDSGASGGGSGSRRRSTSSTSRRGVGRSSPPQPRRKRTCGKPRRPSASPSRLRRSGSSSGAPR